MADIVPRVAALALVAVLGACDSGGESAGEPSCTPIALRVEPVVLTVPRGSQATVRLAAYVEADGKPLEGSRVAFRRRAADESSGEYMGDTVSDARGVAAFERGYVPSVDRERYQRAVSLRAEAHNPANGDRTYCYTVAEAPFTFRET